jgi:hypothetical protein
MIRSRKPSVGSPTTTNSATSSSARLRSKGNAFNKRFLALVFLAVATLGAILVFRGGGDQAVDASTYGIYIYDDLPSDLNFDALLANPTCGSSMFSAEILIHQYLMQSKLREHDPDKAALFFVPLYSSCILTAPRDDPKLNPHLKQREAVKKTLQFIKSNYHGRWEKHQGRDHVWAFTHDFGSCLWHRASGGQRTQAQLEVSKSIILSTVGDKSTRCFDSDKDIVIPPFVDTDAFVEVGQRLDQMKEEEVLRIRSNLAYFRGTVIWNWLGKPDQSYSNGVRKKLYDLYKDDADFLMSSESLDPFKGYIDEMLNATFCLCPRGYASWSPRLVQSAILGCIPVIIADNTIQPFESDAAIGSYDSFSITVPEREIGRLKEILKAVPGSKIQDMRLSLRQVWPMLQYRQVYDNSESALSLIEKALESKMSRKQ